MYRGTFPNRRPCFPSSAVHAAVLEKPSIVAFLLVNPSKTWGNRFLEYILSDTDASARLRQPSGCICVTETARNCMSMNPNGGALESPYDIGLWDMIAWTHAW